MLPGTFETIDSLGKIRMPLQRTVPEAGRQDAMLVSAPEAEHPTWGMRISVGPNPPSDPQVGDLWIATA